MGEVIQFRGITRLNLDPDMTLENLKGQLKEFVVIGYGLDDRQFFASTIADGGDVLWLIERLKKQLLESVDE